MINMAQMHFKLVSVTYMQCMNDTVRIVQLLLDSLQHLDRPEPLERAFVDLTKAKESLMHQQQICVDLVRDFVDNLQPTNEAYFLLLESTRLEALLPRLSSSMKHTVILLQTGLSGIAYQDADEFIARYQDATVTLLRSGSELVTALRQEKEKQNRAASIGLEFVVDSSGSMWNSDSNPVSFPPAPVAPAASPMPTMAREPAVIAPVSKASSQANQREKSQPKRGFAAFFQRKKAKVEVPEVVAPPKMASVQFSAVAPVKVTPGNYVPVNIFMYEEAYRKKVDELIRSYSEEAKEAQSGYHRVQDHAAVRVVLTSDDVSVQDGTLEQIWSGKYLNFDFTVKIPKDFAEEQILLSAAIYVNDIIATRLKLILDCKKKTGHKIGITRSDVDSAFVSYASEDRDRVAAIIQGMRKARPDMDIFFDVESLHSGQIWKEVLQTEIENRDVLFLCWSHYAKASPWVDMEWRYALEHKGEAAIEPIPIEPPDTCPPPVELAQKHFNDRMLYVIRATVPSAEKKLYLLRLKNGEQSWVDQPVLTIGADPTQSDLCIPDNRAVSRAHAKMIIREGQCYLLDLNSTNRTYVNGHPIPPQVETPLTNGTRIALGNEEFVFICE